MQRFSTNISVFITHNIKTSYSIFSELVKSSNIFFFESFCRNKVTADNVARLGEIGHRRAVDKNSGCAEGTDQEDAVDC
jgi:hypothetical protein